VNRVLHDGDLGGSGRRSPNSNCRSDIIIGNATLVAVEVRTAIVDAVGSLLACGNNLGRSVDALASKPGTAAPVVAIAGIGMDRLVNGSNFSQGSDSGLISNLRSVTIFGALERAATFVNAVRVLPAVLHHLGEPLVATTLGPVAAAPKVANARTSGHGLSNIGGGWWSDFVVGESKGDCDETQKGEEGADNLCVGRKVSFYRNRSPRTGTYSW
jgi:hypothetical protein